jgi:hypothetical protein
MTTVRPIFLLGLLALAACGGGAKGGEGDAGADASMADADEPGGQDPCTLVSQAEMERFIGPMGEPPYRVDNGANTDPGGSQCLYRGRDGRFVLLDVDWDGGPLLMKMMGGTAVAAEDLLGTRDVGADTLEGTWDEMQVSFGRLLALKDSTAVTVDALGSRADQAAQARIASLALSRVKAPLKYNGAKAARARPADPAPKNPCSLVTRAEAEALMGPLREDPKVSENGGECLFITKEDFLGSPVENSLKVEWRFGFHSLGEERLAGGMAQKVMGQEMGEIPELQQNRSGGEPWDEEQMLLGGRLTVVAQDILFQVMANGIGGFDEDKARALLRIAVPRALGK